VAKPTFLDALARPFALSQRRLLSERDFASELTRRGLTASAPDSLARLARDRVLEPAVVVSKPLRSLRVQARGLPEWQQLHILDESPPTGAPGLLELAARGLVAPGSTKSEWSWRRRRRQVGQFNFNAFEFLYSPYQLLLIPSLTQLGSFMAVWGGRRGSQEWLEAIRAHARKTALASNHEIALLGVLEPIYYPRITGTIRLSFDYGAVDAYLDWRRSLDLVEVLRWLEWGPVELRKLAERYIFEAETVDPLRRWIELVRLIDPDQWDKLEGAARLAIDLRIAAEMIFRFLEDLADLKAAPELPDIPSRAPHPLRWRLKEDRTTLDETLLDYGLSPHPALLLVVEGRCEEEITPRAMRLLGIPRRDDFIKLFDIGGIDKDTELLAKSLAPYLRRVDSTLAEFLRPPTRVIVVVDAEGKYKTAVQREGKRQAWLRSTYDSLDPEFRTPTARRDLEALVTVTTWSTAARESCFEFAHFSDLQMARAILATGMAPGSATLGQVRSKVRDCRGGAKDWDSVWKGGRSPTPTPAWPKPWPTKLAVWEHLWPVLEKRINGRGGAIRPRRSRLFASSGKRTNRPRIPGTSFCVSDERNEAILSTGRREQVTIAASSPTSGRDRERSSAEPMRVIGRGPVPLEARQAGQSSGARAC